MNATQLIHTCTITTPGASTTVDKDRQPIPGAPTTLNGVGCRYGDLSRTEIANLAHGGLTNVAAYLFLSRTVQVGMKSQISNVTHRLSTVLEEAGPFEIKQINKRRSGGIDYLYCILGRVS